MKKNEYMTPEMETIDLKYNQILCASDGSNSNAGLSDEESEGEPD